MNLIGLILLAALSGGIVAVSLRLRLSSSGRLWLDGERLPHEDMRQGQGKTWLHDPSV